MAQTDEVDAEKENELLKILSIDSRQSLQDLSNALHISKTATYNLLSEATRKYGLHFYPEISLENLWHMEFARQARAQTKRGIIGEATEIMASVGFNEYALQIKFEGKKPDDSEMAAALGKSGIVQFAATTRGKQDVWAYLVARTYDEIRYFLEKLNKNLDSYSMTETVSNIWTKLGFFPLSAQLVQNFNLFDSYRNLVLGLMENGRATFSDIGSKYNQGSTQMLYAYERLARTGVLRHMTYFETSPLRKVAEIAQIRINNAESFEKSKEQWYKDMVEQSEKGECAYTYIADTLSPLGSIAIISASDNAALEREMKKLRAMRGASAEFSAVAKELIGRIAVRNYDMRYSEMYEYLASRNKVKKIAPRAGMPLEPRELGAEDMVGAEQQEANEY
ncbi:MAG: hypothetical protein ACP5T3_01385 [Candidatus Micrarchaeia archaeon]